jgi:cathepsin X
MNTLGFTNYKSGIYSEQTDNVTLTHEISLIGWGTSNEGQEYWIGRNSWGTYWGENGFFRIDMRKNNLGINEDCIWGIPVIDPEEQDIYYQAFLVNQKKNMK